jgi:hypothetical protein
MVRTELTNVEYCRLLGYGYKYITLRATGYEVERWDDVYLKEIILTPHKVRPKDSPYYVLEIDDPEIRAMVWGNETDIFYVERPW